METNKTQPSDDIDDIIRNSNAILDQAMEDLHREMPLSERIQTTLEINDYGNWEDGEYKGDMSVLTKLIIEDVKEWLQDMAKYNI